MGFNEKTDGINFEVFQYILQKVFDTPIELTHNLDAADILLESHFNESMFFNKTWQQTIFFSGEGLHPLPNHAENYTIVMGAQKTKTNYVNFPLYALYEFCKPFTYPTRIAEVPKKNICAIISSDAFRQTGPLVRTTIVQELQKIIHIDMAGAYKNNLGYTVAGSYWDHHITDLQKQYRIVLALENSQLDEYITEKIINPVRAGTIPAYYGSKKINEYFNEARFIQIDPNNLKTCISEINRLCTDDAYWLEMVNRPFIIKSLEHILVEVIDECKNYVGIRSHL